jgi:hypothetical protein
MIQTQINSLKNSKAEVYSSIQSIKRLHSDPPNDSHTRSEWSTYKAAIMRYMDEKTDYRKNIDQQRQQHCATIKVKKSYPLKHISWHTWQHRFKIKDPKNPYSRIC